MEENASKGLPLDGSFNSGGRAVGDLLSTVITGLVVVANFGIGVLIHRNTSAINKQNDILSSIERDHLVNAERQREILREVESKHSEALKETETKLATKITEFDSSVKALINNSWRIIQSMNTSELKIEDTKNDLERISKQILEEMRGFLRDERR